MNRISNLSAIKDGNVLPERVRVLTMDGEMAYWADRDESLRLVGQGFATAIGTKKFRNGEYRLEKVKLLRLTAPIGVACGDAALSNSLPIQPGKMAGQKYYRQESTPSGAKYYEHWQPKGTTQESFLRVLNSVSH